VSLFLDGLARRSEATKVTYGCGLDAFARCFEVESADTLVDMIKAGQLEAYSTLDKFVSWLMMNGFAPKTVRTYLGAAIALLEHEDISLDNRKLNQIELPPNTEISIDRIPSREELRKHRSGILLSYVPYAIQRN